VAVTVRVLYNLAKFYPELTKAAAPLIEIPAELQPLSQRGTWDIKLSTFHTTVSLYQPRRKIIRRFVFSGGGGDDGAGYETLVQHWASHGYCVIQPVHFDSYTHHHAATAAYSGAIKKPPGTFGGGFRRKRLWRARCADVPNFGRNRDADGKIDTARIGIGGYSMRARRITSRRRGDANASGLVRWPKNASEQLSICRARREHCANPKAFLNRCACRRYS
jgi:hypothetical protein